MNNFDLAEKVMEVYKIGNEVKFKDNLDFVNTQLGTKYTYSSFNRMKKADVIFTEAPEGTILYKNGLVAISVGRGCCVYYSELHNAMIKSDISAENFTKVVYLPKIDYIDYDKFVETSPIVDIVGETEEPKLISIKAYLITEKVFYVGDELSTDDFEVMGTYDNGETKKIKSTSVLISTNYINRENKKIEVSYDGCTTEFVVHAEVPEIDEINDTHYRVFAEGFKNKMQALTALAKLKTVYGFKTAKLVQIKKFYSIQVGIFDNKLKLKRVVNILNKLNVKVRITEEWS